MRLAVYRKTTVSCDSEEEGNVPRPRRRRLLSISLRMAFVMLTVLCVMLAFKVRQAERQKAAIAWVETHGGHCYYDYEWDESGFRAHAEPPGPDWLCQLVGPDYFASVAQVSLAGGDINDLSPLYELKDLKMLVLWCPLVRVPDAEIDTFAKELPECAVFYPEFHPNVEQVRRVVDRTVEKAGGN